MSNQLRFHFVPTNSVLVDELLGFEKVRDGVFRYDAAEDERFGIYGPGWNLSNKREPYSISMRAIDDAENIIKDFIGAIKKLYSLLNVGGSGVDNYSSENEDKYFPAG